MASKKLSASEKKEVLDVLRSRFEQHVHRHEGLDWAPIQARLEADSSKLWSLSEMERTGGEPDVIGFDEATDTYIFCDCSLQSPKGRRSICYDREAQEGRKKHPPENNAESMAEEMGIQLLNEEVYRALQKLGPFDTKTSSWIVTPSDIRRQGGALFGDYRYGHVFIYHNGADSYYGARGFRGSLRV